MIFLEKSINTVSIVGPTASGKTKLSVELAKRFNGEIVSADSMQIYTGMQIATAKTYQRRDGRNSSSYDGLSSA